MGDSFNRIHDAIDEVGRSVSSRRADFADFIDGYRCNMGLSKDEVGELCLDVFVCGLVEESDVMVEDFDSVVNAAKHECVNTVRGVLDSEVK